MSKPHAPWRTHDLEVERYEQWEAPPYRFEGGRREFLRVLGGGLLVGLLPSLSAETAPGKRTERGAQATEANELSAWLRVGPDGRVTVYTGKVEVGQGIRTSLAQIAAEELHLEVSEVELVMGDTRLTPYDRGTHGSQSTPIMGAQLRRVAATTRKILIDLAAKHWSVSTEGLTLRGGAVLDASGKRSIAMGKLAGLADRTAVVDADASTVPQNNWAVVGRSIGKAEALAMVTGEHRFVSDLALPGMRHGAILRPPAAGARVREIDATKLRDFPTVEVVRDGDFVGVVGPDPHALTRALAKMRVEWDFSPSTVDSETLFEHLERHPVNREGWGGRREYATGSSKAGMRRATRRFEGRYTVPYIAHVPLEPRAAVAWWTGDRLLVWVGTQHPFPVRDELAHTFGLDPDKVRVRVPDTGSGYGGKHTAETAIEAARLAKSAGAPVKVVWTREEEFRWAYFRPAGVMRIRSGVDRRGNLIAWEHLNVNSGGSGIETPYEVPHQSIVFQPADSPARQGSYRGLACTANAFARESHMDEVAMALGVDPLEFRRRHLRDERLRAVLDAATERFGWAKNGVAPGHGRGLAVGVEKGGYVATVAEIAVGDDGTLTVLRLVTAFECGAVVNPDNLASQIEGSVIMGLGGALYEAIELKGGAVANPRLSQYRVPRFTDVPKLETIVLDRRDLPSAGAGETPIMAVAPALANAIAAATGKRLRHLPLAPNGRLPE